MGPQFQNPIHVALTDTWCRCKEILSNTKWTNPAYFLSGIIMLLAYVFVLVLCCVLWVYGGFVVVAQIFHFLISAQLKTMREKCSTSIEKFPLMIAAGLFTACWLIFALISLPMYLIGWLANLFSKSIFGKLLVVLIVVLCVILYVFRQEIATWMMDVLSPYLPRLPSKRSF